MLTCPTCSYNNAASSKFCRQCGTALTAPAAPVVAAAPPAAPASDAELQASLVTTEPPAELPAEPPSTPTEPLVAPAELPTSVLAPNTKVGDYTILALRDEELDQRVYRAQAPGDVCRQCGTKTTDPEARFCEECGAELLPHEVLLYEREADSEAEATGPWRLVELPDDPLRTLLPTLTAFEENGRRYLATEETVPGFQSLAELLASQGDAPQQPAALDPADALPIALQLAQLLAFLHQHGTSLGDLSLAQLLIGANHTLRLRDVTHLQPLSDGSRQADLSELATTLEDLIRTPRPTQKLDAETAISSQPTLEEILRQGRTGSFADAQAWVTALQAIVTSQQALKPLATVVGAFANVGMVRQLNEDSFLVQEVRLGLTDQFLNAGVYVVADGMGGHDSGEIASRLAVLAISQTVAQQLAMMAAEGPQGLSQDKLNDLVLEAAEAANLAVFQEGKQRKNDMGTTLTFALVVGDRCIIGNVGDSRTYLLREGKLQRISKDHSLVMRLVEVGQISEDEIYTHPHRNAILRSLGEKPQVEVDTFPIRLQPGDALFLCSDGQWEMVRNPRMNEVLVAVTDPQAAAQQLIMEANQNGGEDNITAVIVQFSQVAAAQSAAAATA